MVLRERTDFFLLGAKVKDSTRERYHKAAKDFYDWCTTNKLEADDNEDLDWLFMHYMHDVYEVNGGKGRTRIAQAMAGLQLFVPQLKGHLRLSAQSLLGWRKRHPGRRHPPLTWRLTLAIAAQLARWGRYEMAVGTLLAFVALLRVGEMTGVQVEDFLDARAADQRVDVTRQSGLVLKSTKTAQNLFAEIHNDDVMTLLRGLVQGKRAKDKILQFSANSYRTWFRKAVVSLGLSTRYVPHSLRHGGATALFMQGTSIETILHRGRWATTKSAHYYVQTGESMLLAMQPQARANDIGMSMLGQVVASLNGLRNRCVGVVRAASSRPTKRKRQQNTQQQQPTRASTRSHRTTINYDVLESLSSVDLFS